jgi:hypothetical protein
MLAEGRTIRNKLGHCRHRVRLAKALLTHTSNWKA